jgi:GNAT superfamily N-acetyltransferase
MKRLFVRSAYRGQGVGRALARRALTEAKAAGYSIMILDTLPFMERAIQLYETLGFARSEGSGALSQETISMELHL